MARQLSEAARASATALEDECPAAAGAVSSAGSSGTKRAPAKRSKPASATSAKAPKPIVEPARKGATPAATRRARAASDTHTRGTTWPGGSSGPSRRDRRQPR